MDDRNYVRGRIAPSTRYFRTKRTTRFLSFHVTSLTLFPFVKLYDRYNCLFSFSFLFFSFSLGLYGRNNGELVERLNKNFLDLAPMTLLFDETCRKGEEKRVATEIRKFYFDQAAIDNSTRFQLINVSSPRNLLIRIK